MNPITKTSRLAILSMVCVSTAAAFGAERDTLHGWGGSQWRNGELVSVNKVPQKYAERDAVVKIQERGGVCTGFICKAKGKFYLISAMHCKLPERLVVPIGGKSIEATKIYVSPYRLPHDGVSVHLLDGKDLPYVSIGDTPKAGDNVLSYGYPSGKLEVLSGVVTSVGSSGINTNIPIRAGHSGAPLLNLKGKAVGVASMSAHAKLNRRTDNSGFSVWVTRDDIVRGLNSAVTGKEKPFLYVLTRDDCAPCQRFKRDVALGKFSDYEVVYIKSGAEWKQVTGDNGGGVPRFYVQQGLKGRIVQSGYFDAASLLREVAKAIAFIIRGVANIIHADEQPQPDPRSEPELGPPIEEPPPVPREIAAADEIDWSDVEIVALGAKQDVGVARGALRAIVLKNMTGPIIRKLNEVSEGKVGVHIIGERTMPNRYLAVTNAAGVTPDPFYVLVLVERQPLGLKGLIVGKIERTIREHLGEKVPIEAVFSRINSHDYQAIKAALLTQDAEKYEMESKEFDPKQLAKDVALEAAPLLLPKLEEKLNERLQPLEEKVPDGLRAVISDVAAIKTETDKSDPSITGKHGNDFSLAGIVLLLLERIYRRRKGAASATT